MGYLTGMLRLCFGLGLIASLLHAYVVPAIVSVVTFLLTHGFGIDVAENHTAHALLDGLDDFAFQFRDHIPFLATVEHTAALLPNAAKACLEETAFSQWTFSCHASMFILAFAWVTVVPSFLFWVFCGGKKNLMKLIQDNSGSASPDAPSTPAPHGGKGARSKQEQDEDDEYAFNLGGAESASAKKKKHKPVEAPPIMTASCIPIGRLILVLCIAASFSVCLAWMRHHEVEQSLSVQLLLSTHKQASSGRTPGGDSAEHQEGQRGSQPPMPLEPVSLDGVRFTGRVIDPSFGVIAPLNTLALKRETLCCGFTEHQVYTLDVDAIIDQVAPQQDGTGGRSSPHQRDVYSTATGSRAGGASRSAIKGVTRKTYNFMPLKDLAQPTLCKRPFFSYPTKLFFPTYVMSMDKTTLVSEELLATLADFPEDFVGLRTSDADTSGFATTPAGTVQHIIHDKSANLTFYDAHDYEFFSGIPKCSEHSSGEVLFRYTYVPLDHATLKAELTTSSKAAEHLSVWEQRLTALGTIQPLNDAEKEMLRAKKLHELKQAKKFRPNPVPESITHVLTLGDLPTGATPAAADSQLFLDALPAIAGSPLLHELSLAAQAAISRFLAPPAFARSSAAAMASLSLVAGEGAAQADSYRQQKFGAFVAEDLDEQNLIARLYEKRGQAHFGVSRTRILFVAFAVLLARYVLSSHKAVLFACAECTPSPLAWGLALHLGCTLISYAQCYSGFAWIALGSRKRILSFFAAYLCAFVALAVLSTRGKASKNKKMKKEREKKEKTKENAGAKKPPQKKNATAAKPQK